MTFYAPGDDCALHLALRITYDSERRVKDFEIHEIPVLSYKLDSDDAMRPLSLFNISGEIGYWSGSETVCVNKEYVFKNQRVLSPNEFYGDYESFIDAIRAKYVW